MYSREISNHLSASRPSCPKDQHPPQNLFSSLLTPNATYIDAAGRRTAEGYSIIIDEDAIVISGASPLGAWWGTQTILQLATLKDRSLPVGTAHDASGWAVRGAMVRPLRSCSSETALMKPSPLTLL